MRKIKKDKLPNSFYINTYEWRYDEMQKYFDYKYHSGCFPCFEEGKLRFEYSYESSCKGFTHLSKEKYLSLILIDTMETDYKIYGETGVVTKVKEGVWSVKLSFGEFIFSFLGTEAELEKKIDSMKSELDEYFSFIVKQKLDKRLAEVKKVFSHLDADIKKLSLSKEQRLELASSLLQGIESEVKKISPSQPIMQLFTSLIK